MSKIILFAFVVAGIFTHFGCLSPTHITQEEYVQLLGNAREFALIQEKSLSDGDRKIITESEPRFSVYYTGMKYGDYSLTWTLSGGKILSVEGNGYLTSKDSLIGTDIGLISGIRDKK